MTHLLYPVASGKARKAKMSPLEPLIGSWPPTPPECSRLQAESH
jgi:hypothetical protein